MYRLFELIWMLPFIFQDVNRLCLIGILPAATKITYHMHWFGINNNKRPRGLDALLGHLLIKRIPVMFQLSSTKIPEYLSQN